MLIDRRLSLKNRASWQLVDLGMKLPDLALSGCPRSVARPGKRARHPADGLPLSRRDHRVVAPSSASVRSTRHASIVSAALNSSL